MSPIFPSKAQTRAFLAKAFPGYKLRDYLCQGGMSDIWIVARAPSPPMILKVIPVKAIVSQRGGRQYAAASRRMAVQEALLLERLRGNRNIVQMEGFCFLDENGAVVSENRAEIVLILEEKLCPLTDYLDKVRVDQQLLIRLMREIALALSALHGYRVRHRDIRLPNLYFRSSGGEGAFVLADLGATCTAGCSSGTAFKPLGSCYAPEQCDPALLQGRDLPPSADLFSLGQVILSLSRRYNVPLDSGFRHLLGQVTEPDWKLRRYTSADALLEALAALSSPGEEPAATLLSRRHPSDPPAGDTRIAPPRPEALSRARRLMQEGDYAQAERLLEQAAQPALAPVLCYIRLLQQKPVCAPSASDPASVLLNALCQASRLGRLPPWTRFTAPAQQLEPGPLRAALYYYAGRSGLYDPGCRREDALRLLEQSREEGFAPAGLALEYAHGRAVDPQRYARLRHQATLEALWPV